MARTRFQMEVLKIRDAIDVQRTRGDYTENQIQDIRYALFLLVVGDPKLRKELRPFCRKAKCEGALNWVKNCISREVKIPQALHARSIKKMSWSKVMNIWEVTRTDIALVERLAEEAAVFIEDELHLLRKKYSSMELRWLGEVEEEMDEVEVVISRQALEDLLLGVLETYKVPKSKTEPFSEVFGLCLGMASRHKVNKKGIGTRTKWFVQIEKAVPQIRAKASRDSVIPNLKSIEAVVEAASNLFPQLEIMGDYHSHPYRTMQRMKDVHGWDASPSDATSVSELYAGLRNHPKRKHRLRVSFVIAIAKGRPSASMPAVIRRRKNILHLNTAGCRIFISAYRILSNGEMTSHGVVMAPAIAAQLLEAM